MPKFNPTSNTPIPRFANEQLQAFLNAAEAKFGKGVRNDANTINQIGKLFGIMGFADLEQDMLDLVASTDPRSATGIALESQLWPLYEPLPAKLAAGSVNVNYKSIPTSPSPLFVAGDLDFIDGGGNRFTLNASVAPPTKLFDSNETATASEAIGTGNTKLSQRFPLTQKSYVQLGRVVVTAKSGTVLLAVEVQTDDGTGKPSGTKAGAGALAIPAFTPVVGSNDLVGSDGDVLDAGTYHLVYTVTGGGTVTFDGGAGGTADSVYKYTGGAWVLSTLVENLNAEVIEGGVFPVQANEFGTTLNINALAISVLRAANSTASTRISAIGGTFTNKEAFTGGRLAESSADLRARARTGRASRETCSTDGLQLALIDTTGVESADVVENVTLDWTQDDTLLDKGSVSGSNETIDGTTTRLAQKLVVTQYGSVTAVAINWATMTALNFDLRVETDAAGSPSGTLVSSRTVKAGIAETTTGRKVYVLNYPAGDFLPVGTYWVVAQRNSGSATLVGEATSNDNNAKKYAGSWALATADNLAVQVYGGIPLRSVRAYVDGGFADDIAQTMHMKGGGIWTDGPNVGNAKDVAGRTVPRRFFRSVKANVVMRIDVNVTSAFTGDANTIRDLLIDYVGGKDTKGATKKGLDISTKLTYERALGTVDPRVDSRAVGVDDITLFYVARKSQVATPGSLTSANVVNLPASRGERFTVASTSDILVNITTV